MIKSQIEKRLPHQQFKSWGRALIAALQMQMVCTQLSSKAVFKTVAYCVKNYQVPRLVLRAADIWGTWKASRWINDFPAVLLWEAYHEICAHFIGYLETGTCSAQYQDNVGNTCFLQFRALCTSHVDKNSASGCERADHHNQPTGSKRLYAKRTCLSHCHELRVIFSECLISRMLSWTSFTWTKLCSPVSSFDLTCFSMFARNPLVPRACTSSSFAPFRDARTRALTLSSSNIVCCLLRDWYFMYHWPVFRLLAYRCPVF